MQNRIGPTDFNTTYEDLLKKLEMAGGMYNLPMIESAYRLALEAHGDQKRVSGEPYISHPLAVAIILCELGMDSDSVIAAILHDVIEDTSVSSTQISRGFSDDIARLVDGVTKINKLPYASFAEVQAENFRKMLLAMDEDIRVIIIKLADRLHNMRTLQFVKEQKQRDKARETLELFAPIAHRLGIRAMKEELEDLAIKFLDPVGYKEIENLLDSQRDERETFIEEIKQKITDRLKIEIADFKVEGRVKSTHGIYRKMYIQGKSFDEIYDIYAVRVIVDTNIDCFAVLGIVHDMFSPIPGRFKDYISAPKPNNYQSLHTTVISRKKIPFEIQIRTFEMNHTAEYGIAAHWKYKLGIKGRGGDIKDRLVWIRQLLENQSEADDVEDIVSTIKTDLAPDEVFAVTPKGDIKSLPKGSTVIDFAYAIHGAVGNRMVGAKVDSRIVPIDYVLKTGDVVEILTANNQGRGPSRDWLNIVRTSEAKSKIRTWFKKEKREENIIEGRASIERELIKAGIKMSAEKKEALMLEIAKRQHCSAVDDFLASVGYGGIPLSKVVPAIRDEYQRNYHEPETELKLTPESKVKKNHDGVIVEGIDNCLIKFSRCCNPLPGDDIIGFITRGHGVSIHKKDCTNVPGCLSSADQSERWVKAYFESNVREKFKATVRITATDRGGILADVATVLSNMRVAIHNVNAREIRDSRCELVVTMSVDSSEHLQTIMNKLSVISGVESVKRSGQI